MDLDFELSPIKQMELAASRIPHSISLAQGIPSFPTPQVIKDFIIEKINAGLCDKYSLTIGMAELREEISLALKDEGLNFDPDSEILATAGSIEGITAALLAHTSPGDEVILQSPSYVSYQGAIRIAKAKPVFVSLDEDNNFDFNIEAMERAITPRTRVILYCSPNNPTGTLFSEEKTRKIVDLAEKNNIMILADEVYKDFYYSTDRHFSAAYIKDARQRIIRVCSFSKAYAMTGWRIGFVHADKDILKPLIKFHDAMVSCAPVVSQYGAIAALRLGAPYLENFRNEFRQRRDYTIGVLDSLSHILDYQLPRATYFAFPRIKDTVPLSKNSRALAYDILEKVALATVPGSAFGPSGESHLRINFGREKSQLEEGLERFKNYFNNTPSVKRLTSSGNQNQKPAKSFAKSFFKHLLAMCSRIKLKKKRPLIVGIAGLKGKTVFKRTLLDFIQLEKTARSNLLSYNTALGFPLSILNLENPSGRKNYLAFLFKIFSNTFISNTEKEVLILEYGISNVDDAKHLLSITKPDWLILSEITGGTVQDTHNAAAGILKLAESVPTNRIIWTKEDLISSMPLKLLPEYALNLDNLEPALLSSVNLAIQEGRVVGKSASNSLIAGALLAKNLGFSIEKITAHIDNLN